MRCHGTSLWQCRKRQNKRSRKCNFLEWLSLWMSTDGSSPSHAHSGELLSGAIYSILDAKSSFWQIRLDVASCHYATFTNPFSRIKFLRITFSNNTASEVLWRAMEQISAGYSCAIIVDCIIVGGKSVKSMTKIWKKCWNVPDRSSSGSIQTSANSGWKRWAVSGMCWSKQKSQLSVKRHLQRTKQHFWLMINDILIWNYFIQSKPELLAPFCPLLHKDVVWSWMQQLQDAFHKLKKCVTSTPVVPYHEVQKPVTSITRT